MELDRVLHFASELSEWQKQIDTEPIEVLNSEEFPPMDRFDAIGKRIAELPRLRKALKDQCTIHEVSVFFPKNTSLEIPELHLGITAVYWGDQDDQRELDWMAANWRASGLGFQAHIAEETIDRGQARANGDKNWVQRSLGMLESTVTAAEVRLAEQG